MLSDIFTKEELKELCFYASGKTPSDDEIQDTILEENIDCGEVTQKLIVPIYFTDDHKFPDLCVCIYNTGAVMYKNWSGCNFALSQPMKVYEMIVSKKKEFERI